VYSHLLVTFATARGVLRVADRLDQVGEVELRRRLDDAVAAGCTALEVDCSRVRQIQRPALVALSEAKSHLESRGGALVIAKPSTVFTVAAQRGGFTDLVGRTGNSGPRGSLLGTVR
jgi:hypothetical protein